jgi:hypothetical protein
MWKSFALELHGEWSEFANGALACSHLSKSGGSKIGRRKPNYRQQSLLGLSEAVKQFAQAFVREAMSLHSALDCFPLHEEPIRRSSEARRFRSVIFDSTSLR